tara:strand:- start:3404 stop:3661 length:258 start_codon:yes stop_codon:yes gene_type:complete
VILFKSKNNGVLLLLLYEDRYCKPKSSDGKIGLSSLRITFLYQKIKGQRAKNTPKISLVKGLRIKIISIAFLFYEIFQIKNTHIY